MTAASFARGWLNLPFVPPAALCYAPVMFMDWQHPKPHTGQSAAYCKAMFNQYPLLAYEPCYASPGRSVIPMIGKFLILVLQLRATVFNPK